MLTNRSCFHRLHQAHVIDPDWCEVSEQVKTTIYSAMKVVESLVKEDTANFKEFGYLQATHYNAWKGKDVQPILAGRPDFKSTGKDFYIINMFSYSREQ